MTEQQPFELVRVVEGIEIRRYPEHVLAETRVPGPFGAAGNRAFRFLFSYISGENVRKEPIAMTAPVIQSATPPAASERIAMTAPVTQQADGDEFLVAFVLPAAMTAASAPTPTDPHVRLRTVPARLSATISFTGRWTDSSIARQLSTLLETVSAAGMTTIGEPRFARFDPPYTPWFMRHHEISIDLEDDVA